MTRPLLFLRQVTNDALETASIHRFDDMHDVQWIESG